jgi:hypothetical protein
MSVSARNFLSWIMVVLFPLSLMAGETGSAIVHTKGGVWVNGAEAADSTAIFPGALLETRSGFFATLDAEGSSVLIGPESVVKFEGTFLTLEHGSVSVGTSTSMRVHVKCIRVVPVTSDRTQYDVTDVNGTVQVAAHKNDVNVTQSGTGRKASSHSDSQSGTVHEGEQATREEASACGAGFRPDVANAPNAKMIEIGAAAAGGVVALCLLLCRGPGHKDVSPSQP